MADSKEVAATPAGWYLDPQTTDGSLQRYHDGETWTEHTAPASAPEEPGRLDSTDASESGLNSAAEREPWAKRIHLGRKIIIGFALLVALILGAALGGAGKDDKINSLTKDLIAVRQDRDQAQAKVNNRNEQRRADEASVAAAKTAEKTAADEAARRAEAAAKQEEANRLAAAAKVEAERQAAAAAAAAQAAERASITVDGVYLIGTDKTAGRYRTTEETTYCYWQISSDANGSNIIENDIGSGIRYLQVSNGQYLKVSRCGSWQKVG